MRHVLAILGLTLSLVCTTHPAAQETSAPPQGEVSQPQQADGEAGQVASEVSQEVMSPFCPGKTLAMCTSGEAARARREIQDMARDGLEKEEIKDALISEYGEEFRRVEPDTFDAVPILLVGGFGLLFAVGAVYVLTRGRDDEADDEDDETGGGDDGEKGEYLSELRDEYRG